MYVITSKQSVSWVLAFGDRAEMEPIGKKGRYVFHAVDGDVNLIRQHRFLDLLNEEPLAANLCQWDIKDLVSSCFYFGKRNIHV